MRISVCITVFNEEKTIKSLLSSLVVQSKKANEIIVVDGGSTDSTVEIIRKFTEKHKSIRIIQKKCSRAEGRNIAVMNAGNSIITMTDAGCVADLSWLERIAKPFETKNTDIAAGFYIMKAKNALQKAESVFLGVTESEFGVDFLPSTRSIAFTKKAWREIGGFPEDLTDTAEDTKFNLRAIRKDLKIIRVKSAVVYWAMPKSLVEYYEKISSYAKGDAESLIFWHPSKKLKTHNLKVIFVFFRYAVGFILLFYSIKHPAILILLAMIILIYALRSFFKVYMRTKNYQTGLWGVALQFITDFAEMSGFIKGIKKILQKF